MGVKKGWRVSLSNETQSLRRTQFLTKDPFPGKPESETSTDCKKGMRDWGRHTGGEGKCRNAHRMRLHQRTAMPANAAAMRSLGQPCALSCEDCLAGGKQTFDLVPLLVAWKPQAGNSHGRP